MDLDEGCHWKSRVPLVSVIERKQKPTSGKRRNGDRGSAAEWNLKGDNTSPSLTCGNDDVQGRKKG